MTSWVVVVYFLGTLVVSSLADVGILLLHTNDMHARFQQSDKYLGMCGNDSSPLCYGGFARIRSQVDKCKKDAASKGLQTIFLNAGDSFQGTPYYTFFKWPIVAKFVSMLGIDVMSFGNHEFDDGIAGLAPYITNVTVPIVSCNIKTTQEPSMNQPKLTPSYILTVGNTKVGVIGYITPDTKFLSNIGKLEILEEIPSIRYEAKKLLDQQVSILIAVGHSGYIIDQEIARQVEEIDVVVGGHSHSFLYTGTPPDVDKPVGPYPTVVTQPSGKQVPVVQAFYGTKYLGYLEVYFDDLGNLVKFNGSPILLSGDLPQDPEILQALKPYEMELSTKINHVVGYTTVLLDNNEMKCKLEECNIGNLITDAYVDYVRRKMSHSNGWTKAAIGLNQAGGIRSSINAQTNIYHNGSVTLGDVITVLPWGDKVVVINTTGEALLQALEFSVRLYEYTNSRHVNTFLQVSGIRVTYDINKPCGNRLTSVSVLCADCEEPTYEALEPSAFYSIVMPEYLAKGGDGFNMFPKATVTGVLDDVDYMVMSQYIEHHSPVHPIVEGRITIIGLGSSASLLRNSPLVITVFTIFIPFELIKLPIKLIFVFINFFC